MGGLPLRRQDTAFYEPRRGWLTDYSFGAFWAIKGNGASNVAVFFWDEYPKGAGAAFSLDTPSYIEAGGTHQVHATYRLKACGTRNYSLVAERHGE